MSIEERIETAREATRRFTPGTRVLTSSGKGEIVGPGHGENVHGYVPLWLIKLDDSPSVGYLPEWWDEIKVLS